MDTIRLPAGRTSTASGVESLARLIAERHAAGKNVVVTVADEDEMLSPEQAAQRLGFSRQHVMRLIAAGRLSAETLPGSRYRRIPLPAVLAFEQLREQGRREADAFSASLDAVGAPDE